MDLLGSLVEVRNAHIDRELNTELATVLMDFGFYLIVSVVTLQFVGFGERRLLILELCLQDVWRLLVDGRHDYGCSVVNF
jgi:hypothetical protein